MHTIHRAVVIVALSSGSAVAAAACPTLPPLFSTPHVNENQLSALVVEVKDRPGFSCKSFGPNQILCGSDGNHELWWLTESGHPAHPALSRGQMVTNPETRETCLLRDGYFAGPEEPFKRWFHELKQYDEQTIRTFRRRNAT